MPKKVKKMPKKASKTAKKAVQPPKTPKTPPKEPTQDLKHIFNYDIAGYSEPNMQALKPYYTKVMKGVKAAKGRVVMMDAEKFIKRSYPMPNEPEPNYNLDMTKLKPKFAIPYVDTVTQKGMGRDKAKLCLNAGIKKIPVLVVAMSEGDIDKWLKANIS